MLATAAFGALALPAGADPTVTICGSVHASVNGSEVLGQDSCQVLPPQ
jgi:hypothetical protein